VDIKQHTGKSVTEDKKFAVHCHIHDQSCVLHALRTGTETESYEILVHSAAVLSTNICDSLLDSIINTAHFKNGKSVTEDKHVFHE
jgi:hypothetical protein